MQIAVADLKKCAFYSRGRIFFVIFAPRKMKRILVTFLFFACWLPVLVAQDNIYAYNLDSAQAATDNEFKQEVLSDMDKMLNLWYVRREIVNSNSVLSHLSDSVQEASNMDSLYIMRLKKISTAIPLAYNERVKKWINLYVNVRKRSSSAQLGLAQYYFPWMQEIFDKYGLPEELVYLTIIESSLNPTAVSPAGATGIWQFMYTTGKMYGLEVNTFIDDRRDPVKATDAAARHLKDLYNMFNDWGLAIAAYNCGVGNVRKAILRSGGKTTYWAISPYLPRETQNYFPIYIAAYYMMKYHNAHGITAADISIPSDVDTVMVQKELHLEQVSKVLNISMEELQTLNPQYKRNVVPAYTKPYPLKLRSQDVLRYLELQDSIHAYHYDEYFTPLKVYESQFTGKTLDLQSKKKYHTVRNGETLSRIASKYGLSVYELKKMNNQLEEPTQFKDNQELQKDADQNMQQSQQNLEKNNRSKSADNQKKAADDIEQMADQMEQDFNESELESITEDIATLRQILDNLVSISFEQEEVLNKSQKMSAYSSLASDVMRKQFEVKQTMKHIEDSLDALARRQAAVKPFIQKEVTKIQNNIETSQTELQNRRPSVASKNQQFALTSMNNLALMLMESMKDMQEQQQQCQSKCKKAGNGSCNKPGGKGKPKKASARELQQQLNRQMEAMKKSMEQQGKQGQTGQPQQSMSEQFAKMAAQQEAIRKMLQDYQSELKQQNGVGDKALDKIIEDMQKTEKELVNRQITQQTINRQKDITTRLLQSERADMEREKDKERKSNEARQIQNMNPPKDWNFDRQQIQQNEMLRSVPANLNYYYKAKANNYFYNID